MKKPKEIAKTRETRFFPVIYDFFRSLKLTISLLILLAILSIIGTLITQNATRLEYIQRYGTGLYEVLNFFNLFDMYHSGWFSAILLLLVINLITCSVHRLPAIWSQVSRESGELEDRAIKILPHVETIQIPNPTEKEKKIQSSLKKWFRSWRRIETETNITLFSEKGRYSRWGVPVTHLSILIILAGGILGSLYGFKGHVEILEGETIDRILLRVNEEEVPKPIGFSVHCDDFNITYYDLKGQEKRVKEYNSVLTVLENGKEVLKKTIRVNHPLSYKGLTFYQSNYGTIHDIMLGIQWSKKKEKTIFRAPEGATVPVPNSSDSFIRVLNYASQVHNFGEGVQVVLFKPNQEPQPFWLLKAFPNFDEKRKDEFVFTFEGDSPREFTGLQVTRDPGVGVVWTGCALLIFGLIVSFFFSHQRVWIRIPKSRSGEIILAGSTHKNRVGFENNFRELVNRLRSLGNK
jgi:cytochrome c biogenesis protein